MVDSRRSGAGEGDWIGLVEMNLTQAHREEWVEVRSALRGKLGEERFSRWIAPLKLLSEDGEEVRLGVPNRYVLEWVEKRYRGEIDAALRERAGTPRRLVLVIDPALYRDRRREGEAALAEAAAEAMAAEAMALGRAIERPAENGSGLVGDRGPEESAKEERSAVARDGDDGEREHMTLESFVVGESNRLAFNAALQILESPGRLYNPFFVHGAPGVGKTHLLKGLLHGLRRRAHGRGGAQRGESVGQVRVRYLTGEQFFNQFVASVQDGTMRRFRDRYRSLDVLIVDDVHLLVTKRKTQIEFLHTFNSLAEAGKQVILASDAPPKALSELDGALVGRFLSGLVVAIRKPDHRTRLGIARLQARRLKSRFDDSVLEFLAQSVRGNARELLGAMKHLDVHARLAGEPLSVANAEEALADLIREQERRQSLKAIHLAVAAHYGLTPEKLMSPSRQRHVVQARQVAMYLARQWTGKSLVEIGRFFADRNHSTVRSAIARVAEALERGDERLSWDVEQLRQLLD